MPKASSKKRGLVRNLLREIVGGNGRLTDVDVTEGSETLAESIDLGLVGLDLLALSVLGTAFLLNVEAQVLEKDNLAVVGLVDNGLNLGADGVRGKGNRLPQELLEDRDNGLERVFGVDGTIGAAKVRHENHCLGTIVDGVLDGGESTDDALGVGDVLVCVQGNVEVDLGKKREG